MNKMIDPHNRNLNYLRLSITDRCNMECTYCVPKKDIPRLSHCDILTYEEIIRLVTIASSLGVTKVRVTGGEPLVRKGVCDLLHRLGRIQGITDVALTTNGVLLGEHLEEIKSAGIRRLNISLDSLNRDRFSQITGFDRFQQVWASIEQARNMGFEPIKINVVALRGINDDELLDFARLSLTHPFHVRFIEYMPMGTVKFQNKNPLLVPEIKTRVSEIGPLIPVARNTSDGPAERFQYKDAKGEVGFIGALSHHFCSTCNRLRLTASGRLRPCLLSDRYEDLRKAVRSGCSDEEIARIFLSAVKLKPSHHELAMDSPARICSQMSSIGG